MALNIPITIKIIEDYSSNDAPFVAYSPELDISSCGPTIEKAKNMLRKAITITLKEVEKDGTLEDYLELVGYRKQGKKLKAPTISIEPFYFPVSGNLASKFGCPA